MILAPKLRELATATGMLSARSVRLLGGALAAIEAHEKRLAAVESAIQHLQRDDPSLSLWKCCERLEADLRRFETAFKRIQSGNRTLRNGYEECLTTLLRISGPCCQRRLFELTATRQ
jgi:hypothetical protein